jgi:hypothetical protein
LIELGAMVKPASIDIRILVQIKKGARGLARAIVFTAVLVLSIHAFAQEIRNEWLTRSERPTIAEIMDVEINSVQAPQAESPSGSDQLSSPGQPRSFDFYIALRRRTEMSLAWLQKAFGKGPSLGLSAESDFLKEHGPKLATVIASFEKAYPGLTYAFLGRDSAFLADAVEAFYLAHGQVGRVVRLNASGNSINPAPPEVLLSFLRQNGFRPTANGLERPYIIIDRTSYGPSSQSRRLLSAGYASLLQTRATPEALMRQFAVVNVGSDNNGIAITPDVERDFFRRIKFIGYRHESGPSVQLRISAGGLIDTAFWHQTFSKFEINTSGELVARPGAPVEVSDREMTLGLIEAAVRVASSDEFMQMVRKKARDIFGYDFKLEQRAVTVTLPSEARAAIEKDSVESRLAALEFLRWFDGSIEMRGEILSRMKLLSPELVAERESFLRSSGQKHFFESFSFKLLQYIAAIDLLVAIEEQARLGDLTERVMSLLEDAMEEMAIMSARSKILDAKPHLKEIVSNALKGGQSQAWQRVRLKLEARWKVKIIDGAIAPEQGSWSGILNKLGRLTEKFVPSHKVKRDAKTLSANSLATDAGSFIDILGLPPKARACAAALKGGGPGSRP